MWVAPTWLRLSDGCVWATVPPRSNPCCWLAQAIRQAAPQALIFFECDPTHPMPHNWGGEENREGIVFAPHWYDALTLMTQKFHPFVAVDEQTGRAVFGAGRIRKSFAAQLRRRKDVAAQHFGGIPTLIGETGIPFDLDDRAAFRSGDFSNQAQALERIFRALEDNLLSYTLWNYTPDNTNARGDQWNGEDFSIFSRDQQQNPGEIHSGGRALQTIVRLYPAKIAGELLHLSFDSRSKALRFSFRHNPTRRAKRGFRAPLALPGRCARGGFRWALGALPGAAIVNLCPYRGTGCAYADDCASIGPSDRRLRPTDFLV